MKTGDENKRFWDRIAKRYDRITLRITRDYPTFVDRIADDVRGAEKVLEIATGTGLVALALAFIFPEKKPPCCPHGGFLMVT